MKTMTKKESKIKDLADLRLEITRLKALANEQESYLGDQYELFRDKVAAPARFIKSVASWVPGAGIAKGLFGQHSAGDKDEDWLSRSLRIGLPVVLNRFFLRKAGFIKRALVTVLSQQAAGALNKDTAVSLISKVASLIRPKGKRSKAPAAAPTASAMSAKKYGIPPDSEAS